MAVTHILLMNEHISGLKSPPTGWYARPTWQDDAISSAVAFVIHLTHCYQEMTFSSEDELRDILENLYDLLQEIGEKVDEELPARISVRENLLTFRNCDPMSCNVQCDTGVIESVARICNSLMKDINNAHYDTILHAPEEDIHEEILVNIYEDIKVPRESVRNGEHSVLQNLNIRKSTNIENMEHANRTLIEKGISISTELQMKGEDKTNTTNKEVSFVSKSIHTAKETVRKIADIIQDEIMKVMKKIEEKKLAREEKRTERSLLENVEKRNKTSLPDIPVIAGAATSITVTQPQQDDSEEEDYQEILQEKKIYKMLKVKEEETAEIFEKLGVVDTMLKELIDQSGEILGLSSFKLLISCT